MTQWGSSPSSTAAPPSLRLRLPTEAEWEYACRAGTQTPYSFGETITLEQANFNGGYPDPGAEKGIYRMETVEVRSLPPNLFGLYEMHGNTLEWCNDFYQEYLGTAHAVDPRAPPDGDLRLMRGCCWYDNAATTRSADRDVGKETLRVYFLNFRLARDDAPFD